MHQRLMAKFSDNFIELTFTEEIKFPVDLRNDLAKIRQVYNGVKLFQAPAENFVYISVGLPINLPNRAINFESVEPILIGLNVELYPHECPKVYSDRKNFPVKDTPHVNPVSAGNPYSLCLFRGDSDAWFAEHSILEFITRTEGWLEDAAKGNLNNSNDDFEFTRIDEEKGMICFDEARIIKIIQENWSASGGESGIIETINVVSVLVNESKSIFYSVGSYILDRKVALTLSDVDATRGYVLFPKQEIINSDYLTELPDTVGSLTIWAESFGIDLKNLLSRISSKLPSLAGGIPFTFVIQRPRKLINHISVLEFINFAVYPNSEGEINDECEIGILYAIKTNSRQLARYLSGKGDQDHFKAFHMIGLGAIGSKVAIHLSRQGLIPATLVDEDYTLPHNNIRSGIFGNFAHKVSNVNNAIKRIFELSGDGKNIKEVVHKVQYAYKNGDIDIHKKDEFIIDCTASFATERFFGISLKDNSARYSRVEIADAGGLGILRIEGTDRNPRMDDIMAYLHSLAIEDESISNWLLQNQKERSEYGLRDEIYLGLSCSSDTMILADDNISYHSSVASMALSTAIQNPSQIGLLQLSFLSDNATSGSYRQIKMLPTKIVKCENQADWEIRLTNGLAEQLISLCEKFTPNETGGILLGRIDGTNKVVYVTKILTAPPDSKQSPLAFVRGTYNLTEDVTTIREITGGMIDYIGEWHTHPTGSARLSAVDKTAIGKIKKHLDKIKYPTLVTIVNRQRLHPYIFTDYIL